MEKFNRLKLSKKKIAIILPNYNSSKFINNTIRSIINQTYKHWELIIVDDASDKKTKNILNSFKNEKKIKIYYLKKNKGAGYCRNLGIRKSKSDYLAFIDSDDYWKKNKLKSQLFFMIKNKLKFSYTNYYVFYEKNKKMKKIYCPNKFSYNEFIKNTSIGTSTVMVERDLVKNFKFSNTKICEDYHYKCLILKKIVNGFCLKNFLTVYRVHNDSLQNSNVRNIFWMWKINRDYNKLSFFDNFISIFFISINSLKKYGGKNIFS